jgi:hypothetical protein
LFDHSPGHLQLDHLSGLKKLSITGNYTHCPPPTISGLARLIAKSPQLVYLEVKLGLYGVSPQTPTLHDMLSEVPEDRPLQLTHLGLDRKYGCIDSFTLPHLRSLVSLDLRNPLAPLGDSFTIPHHRHLISMDLSHPLAPHGDPFDQGRELASSTSDIYPILNQEQIYLKEVIVSDIDDVIFDYICSYSGLETLDLCSFDFNTAEESNAFARKFYKVVLPMLSDSIQVLKIQPMYEGGWCYNPEDISQAVALSQCNKLRSLSVALISTFITRTTPQRIIVLHEEKEYFDDAVCPDNLTFFLY